MDDLRRKMNQAFKDDKDISELWNKLDQAIEDQFGKITNWQDDDSTVKLVNDLEEELKTNSKCDKEIVAQMIANAKEFYYHDFKSKSATPILMLINHGRQVGLSNNFINSAKQGKYDA